MAKKWYVFDDFDCFGERDTAAEAAAVAQDLVEDGFTCIEIRHFTLPEFTAFCQGGEQALSRLRHNAK
jgi:hypothetical protein